MFLINRLSSKVINYETPITRLYGQQPDYTFLRTFGCACWPNLRPYNSHKLQFWSKQCVFLGYSNSHKGFKCLDLAEGRIYISRDVVFDEQVYPSSSLRPNVGARLRAELSLLPYVLLNPSSHFGDASLHDKHLISPNSTNAGSSSCTDMSCAGAKSKDAVETPTGTDQNLDLGAPYRMCLPGGGQRSGRG